MIKSIFLFLAICFCQITASEKLPIKEQSHNNETVSLQGEDNFLVYYAFEELENPLKNAMIAYLKKIGNVHLGDISKLSEKEKKTRIKPGPIIRIVFSSLIEENTYSSLDHIKLPVMELSFQVATGAQIVKTAKKQECVLWNQEKFIGTNSEKFKEKSVKIFESMLDKFIKDYQKANPNKENSEAQFYLYS